MRKQARKRGLLAARRGQLQVRARAVDILDILVQVPLSLALSLSLPGSLRGLPPRYLSPWLSPSLALSLPCSPLFLARPLSPSSTSFASCGRAHAFLSPCLSVPLGSFPW